MAKIVCTGNFPEDITLIKLIVPVVNVAEKGSSTFPIVFFCHRLNVLSDNIITLTLQGRMPKSGRIEQSKYKPVMEKAGNYDIK